jgi:hypothetical protein
MPTELGLSVPLSRARAQQRQVKRYRPSANAPAKKLRAARKVERQNRKRGRNN